MPHGVNARLRHKPHRAPDPSWLIGRGLPTANRHCTAVAVWLRFRQFLWSASWFQSERKPSFLWAAPCDCLTSSEPHRDYCGTR
jgi:hypothetical protein